MPSWHDAASMAYDELKSLGYCKAWVCSLEAEQARMAACTSALCYHRNILIAVGFAWCAMKRVLNIGSTSNISIVHHVHVAAKELVVWGYM